MPELVRALTTDDEASDQTTLSVIYQDLIAVLTLVMQEQQERILYLESRLEQDRQRIDDLERKFTEQKLRTDSLYLWMQQTLNISTLSPETSSSGTNFTFN